MRRDICRHSNVWIHLPPSMWSEFSDVCNAVMCMLACQYTGISYLYIVQQHLVYNFFCISSNTKTNCNNWEDVVIRFDSRNLISLLNPLRQSHFKRFFNWKLSHITRLATIIAVPQVLPLSYDRFWLLVDLPTTSLMTVLILFRRV